MSDTIQSAEVADRKPVHYHGDGCPGGHYRRDGGRCVHKSWTCDHCHDDPPLGHTCPECGRR